MQIFNFYLLNFIFKLYIIIFSDLIVEIVDNVLFLYT